MPARLLMVNPSKPRKKKAAKKPSAAQVRARKKFAATARAQGKKKKVAKKKATKRKPAQKKTAAKKRPPARKKRPVRKAKKKTAKRTSNRPRKAAKEKKVAVKRKRTKKRGTKRKAAKRSPKRRTASRKRRATRRNPSTPRRRRRKTAVRRRKTTAVKRRRTRRNPSSKRSTAAKRGWAKRTAKRLKSSRRAAKRAPKRSGRRAVYRARSRALSVKKRSQSGQLSAGAKRIAKQTGLLKVNPSAGFGAFMKDALGLIPAVGVGIGGAVAIGMTGGWLKKKAGEWADKQADPAKAHDGFLVKYSAPLATGTLSAAAYAALRMSKKTARFSGFVLASGWTLTALQILTLIMVKEKDAEGAETGAEVSLGSKMGLPIGGYVAIGAGRPDPNLMVDGSDIRLNGHYDMGGYVADPGIGEYVAMGDAGVFDNSSLGSAQMGYGREGQRARGDEPTAAEILEEGDAEGGVLSGSVFDAY